jgi:2-haloacid dehalogenase
MSAPEALAFDMYGTLVDPIRIHEQLERYLPDEALRVAEVWRQKQLEYSSASPRWSGTKISSR